MTKPYTPGPVLLAAQQRLLVLRAHDAQLKREIAHVMATKHYAQEHARRLVLSAKGLLR
jgi:hypothetical protein